MIDSYFTNLLAIAQTQERIYSLGSTATLFGKIAHRLNLALSTIPNSSHWLEVAGLVLIYTLISLPIGFKFGFLKVDLQTSWVKIFGITVTSFFTPAITEELFFRALLLPHPTENPSGLILWWWGCTSLAIFIVYHPLNAIAFFPPGRPTFMNPVFLFLTAVLGVTCTLAYLQSGSLWPPVFIHWLVVVIWLLVCGGDKRLYG